MSKKAKNKAKDERKKRKADRKAAQRALYQKYRDSGNNQKSKRSKLNNQRGKKQKLKTKKHVTTACGNAGCIKCNPINFSLYLDSKGNPKDMPHWIWQLWKKR